MSWKSAAPQGESRAERRSLKPKKTDRKMTDIRFVLRREETTSRLGEPEGDITEVDCDWKGLRNVLQFSG